MPVKVRDIAIEAGVAVPTAYEALRGVGRLSAASRKAVLDAASRMGYRPNAAARATASGRFNNVGVILGERWSAAHLPSLLLSGIEAGLSERHQHMLLARVPNSKLTGDAQVPQLLRELMVDGLIIAYNEQVPPRMEQLIRRFAVPAIWVNSRHATDCVYADEFAAAKRGTEHLLKLGHRRIAYSHHAWSNASPQAIADGHHSVVDRRAGCLAALTPHALELMHGAVRRGDRAIQFPEVVAAATRCLDAKPRPTAVVCYALDDARAFAVAAWRLGLTLPRDLSIVAFADRAEHILDMPATSLLIPERELGSQAVELLQRKIEQPAKLLPPMVIQHDFSVGGTCAAPA